MYLFPYIQAGTDTKQQQLMEYAVVDKSKKKNKKGDIQQDVSTHACTQVHSLYGTVKILLFIILILLVT